MTKWLVTGGVTAVTYLRARETGEVRERMKSIQKRAALIALDTPRLYRKFLGSDRARAIYIYCEMMESMHAGIVKSMDPKKLEAAGIDISTEENLKDAAWDFANFITQKNGPGIIPIASFTYQATVSPMAVFMAQFIDPKQRGRSWKRALMRKNGSLHRRREQRLISSAIPKDPMTELLEEADNLDRMGFRPTQVADIFDVSLGRMSAWKAHRTMGTYD